VSQRLSVSGSYSVLAKLKRLSVTIHIMASSSHATHVLKNTSEHDCNCVLLHPFCCDMLEQVLCQEMLRFNRLIDVIRNSLVDLDKALQGFLVMSTTLDTLFKCV